MNITRNRNVRRPRTVMGRRTVMAVCMAGVLSLAAPVGVGSASTSDVVSQQADAADAGAPSLERGERSQLVAWWQDRLNEWLQLSGSDTYPIVVDGWYGPNTEAATIEFQEATDAVPADGIVDPEDRVALRDAIDDLATDAGAPSLERGERSQLVAWWQDRLNEWLQLSGSDTYPIVVDGWYGPNTEAATIEFQEATDAVPADGIVDPEDRVALRDAIDDLAGGADDDTTDDDRTPPVSGMVRCSNPEGFSIAYPSDWSVNDGDVVPPCSQFDPDPFEVPAGDERVAAITAYVDPVAFQAVIPPSDDVESRASTEVGGRQAVRLETVAGSDGLYPEGTAATSYLVDLTDGVGPEGETLILDVIDLGIVDYARAVTVLDRMFGTLELADSTGDESVVASYHGASTSITVRAEPSEQELCLTWEEADLDECVGLPEDGSVTAAGLGNELSPLIVGAAGPDVFRVVAVDEGVHETAFLPTIVPGADVRAWAIPGTLADLDAIETFDAAGDPLGSIAVDETAAPAPSR